MNFVRIVRRYIFNDWEIMHVYWHFTKSHNFDKYLGWKSQNCCHQIKVGSNHVLMFCSEYKYVLGRYFNIFSFSDNFAWWFQPCWQHFAINIGVKGIIMKLFYYCSLNREICFLRHSSSFEFTKRKVMTNINNKRKMIYEAATLVLSSSDKESGLAWKKIKWNKILSHVLHWKHVSVKK